MSDQSDDVDQGGGVPDSDPDHIDPAGGLADLLGLVVGLGFVLDRLALLQCPPRHVGVDLFGGFVSGSACINAVGNISRSVLTRCCLTVRFSLFRAFAGDDVDADDLAGGGGVDQRAITDAVATVKAHRDGDADRLMPSKVDAAYITLWSLRELGIVE
jgi:hypothetical protein